MTTPGDHLSPQYLDLMLRDPPIFKLYQARRPCLQRLVLPTSTWTPVQPISTISTIPKTLILSTTLWLISFQTLLELFHRCQIKRSFQNPRAPRQLPLVDHQLHRPHNRLKLEYRHHQRRPLPHHLSPSRIRIYREKVLLVVWIKVLDRTICRFMIYNPFIH